MSLKPETASETGPTNSISETSRPEPRELYPRWLQANGVPLYYGGQGWWMRYRQALFPASLKPRPARLEPAEAQRLLRDSGAALVRYFSREFPEPSEFWYVLCREYKFEELSKKARNQVRRGQRECRAERIELKWLGEHGYGCYRAAFARYKGAKPPDETAFVANLNEAAGGPFEYWAVFRGDALAGYAKIGVEDDLSSLVTMKLDPAYLADYASYALMDALLAHYVASQAKPMTNGFRSISHDTNMQEFLLKFNFCNVYCDLCVHYAPRLARVLRVAYPMRRLIYRLPDNPKVSQLGSLLRQEAFRRATERQAKLVPTN